MWLRYLFTILAACWLLSIQVAAGDPCYRSQDEKLTILNGDRSHPEFEPKSGRGSDYTFFRGLRLGMSEPEARAAVQGLGFALVPLPSSHNAMHICMGLTDVGTIRFDQQGGIVKIELGPKFFAISKVVLREFADSIFEHYKVRRTSVADDVCLHDVTCFRGTTSSEQVLILRIAGDVQLHIARKRSSLTQN